MSAATMDRTSPTFEPIRLDRVARATRRADEALERLLAVSSRIIDWMRTRTDRVSEAYLKYGPSGWRLYVLGKTAEHDFQTSRELSDLMILLVDAGEFLDPILIPLSTADELKGYFDPTGTLRLLPG